MSWAARDLVVLILATAVGTSLLMAALGPLLTKQPLSEERSNRIAAIIGAIIAIIAAYLAEQ